MARIRTIKPEFWTDETVVQLPYEARLFFIGLWNYADDSGILPNSPDRLKMQLFPADSKIDVESTIGLLEASGLISYAQGEAGEELLMVNNFNKHQKISHPTESKFTPTKKRAIPERVRREVATKYGCEPGKSAKAECYYCGSPGNIYWWKLPSGKPSAWVSFSDLTLDHVKAESKGGEAKKENIVLACGHCNKSKGNKDLCEFLEKTGALRSPLGNTPRKGREGKGREGKGREGKASKLNFRDHVTLTQIQHDKLLVKFDQAKVDQCYDKLEHYKASSGKKYKSDYDAILSWVAVQVDKDNPPGTRVASAPNKYDGVVDYGKE